MTEPLFYSAQLADLGATLTLTGDEAHHAASSRRLQAGDTLWLFDGHGGLARATLLHAIARGRELSLRIEERRSEARVKPVIHLACALPKGDRQKVLLDMATQLGMSQFTPLICERSVVQPETRHHERWQRVCLEACKQSRRLYLPLIHPPATPGEAAANAATQGDNVWIAHPGASALSMASAVADGSAEAITILVGPEGGFTEAEVSQAAAHGKMLQWGSAILRVETAGVALVAAFVMAGG